MGGHEARAFMKYAVGATPSSSIKIDKKSGTAYAQKPKSHSSSSNDKSSKKSKDPSPSSGGKSSKK